jgi:hypothetical protein
VMLPVFAQVAAEVAPQAYATAPGYALGWGTLSLINAGLAQSKNHSGLVWWLISLVLGPIATFIIVAFLQKIEVAPVKFASPHDLS